MKRLEEQIALILRLLEKQSPQLVKPLPWRPWMGKFLEDLERHRGVASRAIELSPRSRPTAYDYRLRNEKFRSAWDEIVRRFKEEGPARAEDGEPGPPPRSREEKSAAGARKAPPRPARPGLPDDDREARRAVLRAFRHDDVEDVIACLRAVFFN